MYFLDRYDAAVKLAPLLEKHNIDQGVVLAVPRDVVPVGYYLAKHFDFPLELLPTKEIEYPASRKIAIEAVNMKDSFNDDHLQIPEYYIEREINRMCKSLTERYEKFVRHKKPVDIKNKTVIVTDDGVITGGTILASLKTLRSKQPKKLIVAVPVCSSEAAKQIQNEADEFICVYLLEPFYSVGRFYHNYSE